MGEISDYLAQHPKAEKRVVISDEITLRVIRDTCCGAVVNIEGDNRYITSTCVFVGTWRTLDKAIQQEITDLQNIYQKGDFKNKEFLYVLPKVTLDDKREQ